MSTTLRSSATSSMGHPRTDWVELARQLGPAFAARAARYDADDAFVADNYRELKQHKVFCSGCPMGNVLMTSAVYDGPDASPMVLIDRSPGRG